MAYTYGNTQNAAERIKEISGVNPLKCMKCGKCSATCPAFNEMDIKPHQFEDTPQQLLVSAFRRYRR